MGSSGRRDPADRWVGSGGDWLPAQVPWDRYTQAGAAVTLCLPAPSRVERSWVGREAAREKPWGKIRQGEGVESVIHLHDN